MTVEQTPGNSPAVSNVMRPLSDAAGWMKLLGTLSIIQGVLIALTIIGLVIAWLPIWMGILLNRAADQAKAAHATGDEGHAITATKSLQTIFKVYGVILMIVIVVYGVALDHPERSPDSKALAKTHGATHFAAVSIHPPALVTSTQYHCASGGSTTITAVDSPVLQS
jgi:hypothetical protein